MSRSCVLLALLWVISIAAATPQTGGFAPDISSREESRAFFNGVYLASNGVNSQWTGKVSEGRPGTTSEAFRNSVLSRTNFFRAMAGLPADLVLNEEYSQKAQQMALMISANVELSHFPPSSWLFYTSDGAEAARNSNLALGDFGPSAISNHYMKDFGGSNTSVGHRRWILLPQLKEIGTGDIPSGSGWAAGNALWVLDEGSIRNPRPTIRDEFVAWPPPGMVPYQVVYPRWSFSFPEANFEETTVTLTDPNGNTVPLLVEHRSRGGSLPESTIVWRPASMHDFDRWPRPTEDAPYHVVVSNVNIGGATREFSYTVTLFDPTVTGTMFTESIIRPQEEVVVAGQPHGFEVSLPSYASAFQLRLGRLEPYERVDTAVNGLEELQVKISPGYSPVHEVAGDSEETSFHLAHPTFEDQWIELDRTISPSDDSVLSFRSRLGWATSDQIAQVQVLVEGDSFWRDLYEQAGTGDEGELGFTTRELSLSAFSGKTIRIRFVYARRRLGSVFFFQTVADVGWRFDEITISNARELTAVEERGSHSGSVAALTIDVAGHVGVQVRPIAWGYGLEWGPLLSVMARESGPGYTEWAAGLAAGGPHDDSNGDGLSNLLAYALGAGASEQALLRLPVPGKQQEGFTYSIPSSNKQDITYSIWLSEDLVYWREIARKEAYGSWEALEQNIEIEPNLTGIRILQPPEGKTALFFQLRVDLP